MKEFKIGETIGVLCDVKPGPFSGEQMITIETIDGAISGFVRENELRQQGSQWYVRGRVENILADSLEVWIRGSFLTTNGIASVPSHLAMAA